jgi:hypothetical protein
MGYQWPVTATLAADWAARWSTALSVPPAFRPATTPMLAIQPPLTERPVPPAQPAGDPGYLPGAHRAASLIQAIDRPGFSRAGPGPPPDGGRWPDFSRAGAQAQRPVRLAPKPAAGRPVLPTASTRAPAGLPQATPAQTALASGQVGGPINQPAAPGRSAVSLP